MTRFAHFSPPSSPPRVSQPIVTPTCGGAGEVELQGIAARGDYDLTQHQKSSGKSMEYFDEIDKRKSVTAGVDYSRSRRGLE
jgi:glycyl-tRNA synthetase (class II)